MQKRYSVHRCPHCGGSFYKAYSPTVKFILSLFQHDKILQVSFIVKATTSQFPRMKPPQVHAILSTLRVRGALEKVRQGTVRILV